MDNDKSPEEQEKKFAILRSELEEGYSSISALTSEVAGSGENLNYNDEEFDEFVNMASQNLLEPMRKINTLCDILKLEVGEGLSSKAVQDLSYIMDTANRMQKLVNDLSNLSNCGLTEIKRENISLDICVDAAHDILKDSIDSKGARIKRDVLPIVWGDRAMLTNIYHHLIDNALKFSGDVKPVVHLTAEEIESNFVFGVRDNGIGIKPEQTKDIFIPFRRLDDSPDNEGSGVGLSICQKLVMRHGGEIWVESLPGSGSHFKFTLSARKKDKKQ